MKAKIRDTEIFFDVDGAAVRPRGDALQEHSVAFLVHGGPGVDHNGYKVTCAPLTSSMQLVYFDHRGHGRSGRGDPNKYTLDENVEDMEALRSYLGVERIVSIGASYGGMVAMAHAARYPRSVSRLILISTASHYGLIDRAKEILVARGTPEQRAAFSSVLDGRIDTIEDMTRYFEVMGSIFSTTFDPTKAKSARARSTYSPEPLNQAWGPGGFLRSFDLRNELGAITAPTLVLGARYDWICAPEFSAEIQRLIPAASLEIFEKSGHLLTTDDNERFVSTVTRFVTQ